MKYFSFLRLVLLCIFFSTIDTLTCAQNFHLVKDINTLKDANPDNSNRGISNYSKSRVYAVLNGISYFSANDGIHGRGLWRSDGSEVGTYQVKAGITPDNIIVSNGKLFFAGSGSVGLWKSDGTEAGTMPVLSVVPGVLVSFIPHSLTNLNGTVYFGISGRSSNDQLWKTDGTSTGTVLVKDFYSSNFTSSFFALSEFKAIKNKLYFSAAVFTNFDIVNRLWVSDGSPIGTYIISNTLATPSQMVAASSDISNPLVYFTASTTQFGDRSLYVTNGESGVASIANGFTGIISRFSYTSEDILNVGGFIYFIGRLDNSAQAYSLYKYNITGTESIQSVKTVSGVNANGSASYVYNLIEANNTLFFQIYDAPNNTTQLWKSNGSDQGNVLLKDALQGFNFFNANGVLYFSSHDPIHGLELWKSDGTVNGTELVKDIHEGDKSSNPAVLTSSNNKLLFSANDSIHGTELWQSDGTENGTSLVKDINQITTSSSNPYFFSALNNELLFSVLDDSFINGKFWKSDGTEQGTKLLSDTILNPWLCCQKFTVRDSVAYFGGRIVGGKSGIYKTNGTVDGTILLKDLINVSIIDHITATDSLVYFFTTSSRIPGFSLWRTDGTNANTYSVKNDFNSSGSLLPIGVDNLLFFVGPGGLWKSDGTISGTIQLNYAFTHNLAAHNHLLFFNASSGLWKSDGSLTGTVKITDNVSDPANFISSNNELFFTATGNTGVYGDVGMELFKTDGTEDGTVLVKDIHHGNNGTFIYAPISMNGIFYFFTDGTPGGNKELWRSDGTTIGTQPVSSIGTGTVPTKVVTSNGKLLFVFNKILWESDGTEVGTHTVVDNIFSEITIDNSILASVGNKLFFAASNYQYGKELYAGNIDPALVNYTSTADGNWDNPGIWKGNIIPPPGANVTIRHNVVGNLNVTCSSLNVELPGGLTIKTGIKITVVK